MSRHAQDVRNVIDSLVHRKFTRISLSRVHSFGDLARPEIVAPYNRYLARVVLR